MYDLFFAPVDPDFADKVITLTLAFCMLGFAIAIWRLRY